MASFLVRAAIFAAASTPTLALAQADDRPTPEVFDELIACRSIEDPTERLACFERQVAEMEAAEQDDSILVIDAQRAREEMREAEREQFGLDRPDPSILERENEDRIDFVESRLTAVTGGGLRRLPWRMRLEDGSLWQQIDRTILSRAPQPGHSIRIERAALGSFRARVDGMRLMRVRRVE